MGRRVCVCLVINMTPYLIHLTGTWQLGWILCDIWISLDVLLCTASILSLCAISIDRWVVITRNTARKPFNLMQLLYTSFLLHLHKVFGRHPAVKLFAQKTVETTGSRHDPDRLGAGGRHHLSTDTGHVRQHCAIIGWDREIGSERIPVRYWRTSELIMWFIAGTSRAGQRRTTAATTRIRAMSCTRPWGRSSYPCWSWFMYTCKYPVLSPGDTTTCQRLRCTK